MPPQKSEPAAGGSTAPATAAEPTSAAMARIAVSGGAGGLHDGSGAAAVGEEAALRHHYKWK